MSHTRTLMARAEALRSERDDRIRRGVAVPGWIHEAIRSLDTQLSNAYHYAEADRQDEAQFADLEPVCTDAPRWPWWLAGALVCIAGTLWIGLLR